MLLYDPEYLTYPKKENANINLPKSAGLQFERINAARGKHYPGVHCPSSDNIVLYMWKKVLASAK